MSTPRWDEYLVHEHELIERAMAVLKQQLADLRAAASRPRLMARALDFLLAFGDRVHNVKEERFLFPLMEERGIPREGGPLGVMLREHEAERELLARMLRELPGLAGADDPALERFRDEGFLYLEIRAAHIWKENDVLYPMGRRVLGEEDNAALLAHFEALNAEAYGPGALAHFERMVSEMDRSDQGRLVDALSRDQLHAMLETLPVEVTFVDADDCVAYFNRLDKPKIFVRSRSVVGRKVMQCHPEKSAHRVEEIVRGFKDGTLDKAEFWIDLKGEKVLIRYFPVRSDQGEYLGVLEVSQEIGWIQKLEGQKRLL